jgi:hypothetical protein
MTLQILREAATGSGTDTWMNCPASVALAFSLPQEESPIFALEGDWAHDKSANYLLNGSPLAAGEDEAIRVYVEAVRTHSPLGAQIHVEERLYLLGTSGQIDAYSIKGKTAYLFDFKYGIGKKLRANGNGQLAFYACAIKERHPEITRVVCYLIQPRVNDEDFGDMPAVTTWVLTWQGLRSWRIRIAEALESVERAAHVRAGEWCQFCRVRGGCPAHLAQVQLAQIRKGELSEISIDWTPENIPKIAKALTLKKVVTQFFVKAEEFLLAQRLSGRKILDESGKEIFELGEKRAYRRWVEMFPEDEIATDLLKAGVPEEKVFKKELVSPAQVEKLIGKKRVALVANLWEKPKGGPRLRPAGKNDDDEE